MKPMICSLDIEINSCPHLSDDGRTCNSDNSSCTFRKESEAVESTKYIRKQRWYDKYYKK